MTADVPRFISTDVNPVLTDVNPALLTTPGTPRAALVVLHGPGENRTGAGYLFTSLARTLARRGVATARFDLAGFGESMGTASLEVWGEQCRHTETALRRELGDGDVPVHWLSRGVSAALLPDDATNGRPAGGHRLALSPPLTDEVQRLAALADGRGRVVGRASAPAEEALLWARLGTHPTMIEGLELEADLLLRLSDRLSEPRWDTELGPADRPPRVRSWVVVTESDPLVHLEAARVGLIELIADYLEG